LRFTWTNPPFTRLELDTQRHPLVREDLPDNSDGVLVRELAGLITLTIGHLGKLRHLRLPIVSLLCRGLLVLLLWRRRLHWSAHGCSHWGLLRELTGKLLLREL
jgi:hypothetical protein